VVEIAFPIALIWWQWQGNTSNKYSAVVFITKPGFYIEAKLKLKENGRSTI